MILPRYVTKNRKKLYCIIGIDRNAFFQDRALDFDVKKTKVMINFPEIYFKCLIHFFILFLRVPVNFWTASFSSSSDKEMPWNLNKTVGECRSRRIGRSLLQSWSQPTPRRAGVVSVVLQMAVKITWRRSQCNVVAAVIQPLCCGSITPPLFDLLRQPKLLPFLLASEQGA